jgi:hypothetical protein
MLEQVLTCQALIVASAVLACKGKQIFKTLTEFLKKDLGG